MNVYSGKDGDVKVNGNNLPMCLNVANHSPTGFAWGYLGSGPAQLALAILCYEYGKDLKVHPVHYQEFKAGVISKLPPSFSLTSTDVKEWVVSYRQRQTELLEAVQAIKEKSNNESFINI